MPRWFIMLLRTPNKTGEKARLPLGNPLFHGDLSGEAGLLFCVLSLFLLSFSGCFGAPAPIFPETVPFTGVVTLDGEPLEFATIVFTPNSQGTTAIGSTDAEGNYNMFVASGSSRKEGVVPGEYKVHISTLMPPPPAPGEKLNHDRPAIQQERVPEQYNSLAKTKLKVTVPSEGGSQDFDLKTK